ncbi:transposase [Catenulispora sp. MAP12-49]|uniref:transposase n=1 Tax=Catenulispora sp. MAP12-49 TaxID=3156302 RepID=UPI0035174DB8
MPKPHPPEFRRRAVELARAGKTPIGQLAKDLGISYSCLRHWVDQAEVDDGVMQGLSTAEKEELAALRRRTRQLELENEILRKAAAYFARDNVLPK